MSTAGDVLGIGTRNRQSKGTSMTIRQPRVEIQQPLPDLPLIREDLLLHIEQRQRDDASTAELLELRDQYEQLPGLRRH